LNNPSNKGYITYTLDHPPCGCIERYYSLCSCYKDEDDWYNHLQEVHKHRYESECTCKTGKKYYLLRQAYEEAAKKKSGNLGCHYGWSIRELIQKYALCEEDKTDIIRFMESHDDVPVDYTYQEYEVNTNDINSVSE
jgi:hypothetical protein